MLPIVKTEAKTIESAKEALSDETISSISLAGGQISTQFIHDVVVGSMRTRQHLLQGLGVLAAN